MKPETLKILECPGCRTAYRAVAHRMQGERVAYGYLTCECRAAVIPVVEGFVLFTEALLHAGLADERSLETLAARLFGGGDAFWHLYREKQRRGVFESYAAFQPFNESARAVEPLLPALTGHLRDGDCVLDAWCRTGWSGEWLAGALPRQHVVALWEGDASVLGYRGFRHLLGIDARAPNLDVIFAHAERGLPFRGEAFGLFHAHDALHRKQLHSFGTEALRVTRRSGALVFPHVHLSNSEPDPFFERGGVIRHGRDYRAWLDAITEGHGRSGLVCSERTLFRAQAPIGDEWNTPHYNGLVAILPADGGTEGTRGGAGDSGAGDSGAGDGGARDGGGSAGDSAGDRFMVNPMFRVDLGRGIAAFNPQALAGGCAELMLRHPVYRERISNETLPLGGCRLPALVLAAAGLRREEIIEVLGAQGGAALVDLSAAELLRPAAVSAGAHRLQRFHSNQLAAVDDAVWPHWLDRLRDLETPMMNAPDGTVVTAGEVAELMSRMGALLPTLGVSAGDSIGMCPTKQPLLWVAAVAAAMSGAHVDFGARARGVRPALWLHDDDTEVEDGASLALSRGGANSLLGRLAEAGIPSSDESGGARARPRGGLVRFPVNGAQRSCRMEDLARGCLTLEAQDVSRLWAIDGREPFVDLVRVCAAIGRGDRIMAL